VVNARALVNATGPWVGEVLNHVIDAHRTARVRLVKGSHIVVRRLFDHDRAYVFQNADGRIVFAIPYESDFTLIGTTDEDFHGDPGDVAPDIAEIAYLTTTVSDYFRQPVYEDQIVWSYAGIRALYDDGATRAQEATRDYVLDFDDGDGRAPLLSVIGGKITTSRRLAEQALALFGRTRAVGKAWTAGAALPGGSFEVDGAADLLRALRAAYPFVDEPLAARLVRSYGTLAPSILSGARRSEDLGRVLGADLTEAEARYLMREEWARTADDILWRRSKLGLRFAPADVAALEDWLAGQRSALLDARIAGTGG
jgi:glycerol-3-phosphate dehydrogenase